MNFSRPGRYSAFRWSGILIPVLLVCSICSMDRTANAQKTFEFKGTVVDTASKKEIYSRVYLSDSAGKQYLVQTASPEGEAIPYDVKRGESTEVHTTLSNHPFHVKLSPGKYVLTVEHGKEYLPETLAFEITDQPLEKTIGLKRWSNIAASGWYSGEVHIHRKVSEMPTVVQAEDLNVVLPLTYWVTDTNDIPSLNNKSNDTPQKASLIKVTESHVIWPMNTEYEIFSVRGKRHTLGAFFILGHESPLELNAPPIAPVEKVAREQNAIIDLDKHNWPWSMMLIPQMKVDLFELTNNHVWRTKFLFKDWYKEYSAPYMNLSLDKSGNFTPRGWLDFGFFNYYALLNCGFNISPSGGTASGVHPVPAGFGRVYVHLPNGFSYKEWMNGLKAGRSFVTNGPMLDVKVDSKFPGHVFDLTEKKKYQVSIKASLPTRGKTELQLVVNGEVLDPKTIRSGLDHNGVMVLTADVEVELDETSWLCARCTQEQTNGNVSFAHSAPFYFQKDKQPQRPRKEEIDYLIRRVEDEIKRNRGVLSPEQMAEFESALQFYLDKKETAK